MQNPEGTIFIYPNPANDVLNISFSSPSPVAIQLFDMTGRNIKSISTTIDHISMNVSDLNNGMYFCTITGKDFTSTRKILINK